MNLAQRASLISAVRNIEHPLAFAHHIIGRDGRDCRCIVGQMMADQVPEMFEALDIDPEAAGDNTASIYRLFQVETFAVLRMLQFYGITLQDLSDLQEQNDTNARDAYWWTLKSIDEEITEADLFASGKWWRTNMLSAIDRLYQHHQEHPRRFAVDMGRCKACQKDIQFNHIEGLWEEENGDCSVFCGDPEDERLHIPEAYDSRGSF